MPSLPYSRRAILAGLGAALLASPAAAQFVPQPDLHSEAWRKTGDGGDPDYGPWADFLARWLRPAPGAVTLVDYAGAVAAGARAPLRPNTGITACRF